MLPANPFFSFQNRIKIYCDTDCLRPNVVSFCPRFLFFLFLWNDRNTQWCSKICETCWSNNPQKTERHTKFPQATHLILCLAHHLSWLRFLTLLNIQGKVPQKKKRELRVNGGQPAQTLVSGSSLYTVCGLLLGLRCSPTQSDRIWCSCKVSHIIGPVAIRWWRASERAVKKRKK